MYSVRLRYVGTTYFLMAVGRATVTGLVLGSWIRCHSEILSNSSMGRNSTVS